MGAKVIRGYKLFRLRKDGTLGSLFINRQDVLKPGKWLKAKSYPTEGFAVRPGWHATSKPVAPHLSKKGRVWKQVELRGVVEFVRPQAQGGLWYLAKEMRIVC